MYLSQQILKFFQILAPERVLLGKKIFHRVTEALDANTQLVQCNLRSRAYGALVQFISSGPLFQRQMKIDNASRTHPRGAPRQSPAPLAPALAVKLIQVFPRQLL